MSKVDEVRRLARERRAGEPGKKKGEADETPPAEPPKDGADKK